MRQSQIFWGISQGKALMYSRAAVLAAGLVAVFLAACGSSSSSSTPAATTTTTTCPIPAYTFAAQTGTPPTVHSDCSVSTIGGSHVHLLFTAPAPGITTTMTVNGSFDTNLAQLYFLFYGRTNLGDGTGGWVVLHDFTTGAAPNLHFSICAVDTVPCSPSVQAVHNYTNGYVAGTAYTMTVQITEVSTGDTYKAWADTNSTQYPAGDFSGALQGAAARPLMAVHIVDATVKSVTIQ